MNWELSYELTGKLDYIQNELSNIISYTSNQYLNFFSGYLLSFYKYISHTFVSLGTFSYPQDSFGSLYAQNRFNQTKMEDGELALRLLQTVIRWTCGANFTAVFVVALFSGVSYRRVHDPGRLAIS